MKKKKKVKRTDTKAYQKKELRRLIKKCLKLWSAIVKKRAENTCEIGYYEFMQGGELASGVKCSAGPLNAHHMENCKLNKALRFAPENGLACCPGHHKFFANSAHKSFVTIYQYMTSTRNEDMLYLIDHYKDHAEITREFLENKIHEFEDELKQ